MILTKTLKKVLAVAVAATMTLSTVAMAAVNEPGYIVNGTRYLSSDLQKHPEELQVLNNALGGKLGNLVVDLGTSIGITNYGDFAAAYPGALNTANFMKQAAAHPYTVPQGSMIYNPLTQKADIVDQNASTIATITSVNAVADINVPNGTALSAVGLPTTVSVKMSDNTTTAAAVAWDGGTPAYDGTKAGTYVFSGTVTGTTLKASVNVIVAAANAVTISSVNAVPDINVVNGTALSAVGLPTTVGVKMSDNTTTTAAVAWDGGTPAYNGTKAGTYVFSGTVTGTTLKASANVVVAAAAPTVATVAAITVPAVTAGTVPTLPATVQVTMSDNTTAAAVITWNAAASAAATYATAGTVTVNGVLAAYNNYAVSATVTVNAVVLVPTTVTVAPVSVEEGKTATPVVTVKDQNGNAMTTGYTLGYAMTAGTSTVDTTGVITGAAYSTTAANNANTLTVTATPTTGSAITGTATVTVTQDSTKPTIVSVTAVCANQIQVVYSEKVTQATAETIGNYKLYSVSSGVLATLNAAGGANTIGATAKLQSDGKTVLISLTNTSTNAGGYLSTSERTGYAMNGLTNTDYILYVSSINDRAATANTIVANSNKQFTGTTTPDTTPPSLLSASYDTGLNQLTLNFSEVPTVDVTKMSIVNGTTNVALTGASSSVNGLTATITLTAAQVTALGTLGANATASLAAGAVQDASTNANTAVLTAVLTQTVRPAIAASSYDENTSKLTVNFSLPIQSATVDVTKIKVQWTTDGTTYNDLATVDTSNYTLAAAASSTSTLSFTLNQTAIDAMGAKRATAGVTYRVGLQDAAVTTADGTLSNDTGAAGGTDWQYAALSYTKETTAPTITAAKFYTTASASTPRYTGDTTGVSANHLYITFDQSLRPASVTNDNNLVLSHGSTPTVVSITNAVNDITTAATLLADGKTLDVAFNQADLNSEIADMAAASANVQIISGSSLTDVNKNAVAAQSVAVTYTNNATAGTVSASFVSNTQIKLTQGTTNFGGTVSASNFTVYTTTNVNDVKAIKSVDMIDTNNDGIKDAIYITLNATPGAAVTVAYTGLKDSLNNTITDSTASAGTASADGIAPTLVGSASTYTDTDSSASATSGDKVTLFFNEPVKLVTSPTLAAAYGTGATIAMGDAANKVVITLGSTPAITFGTTKLEGVAGNMVTDITGNNFDGTGVNIPTPTGASAPTLATGGVITATDVDGNGVLSAGDKITIPFSKTLNTTTTIDPTKFTLTIAGSGANAATTFTAAASGSNVVLTFTAVNAADAKPIDATSSIAITGLGSGIKSLWGVEIGNVTTTTVTPTITAKPYITSAMYNSNTHKLKVVFSEAVNLQNIANVANLGDVFSVTSGNSLGNLTNVAVGTGIYLDASDTTNKTAIFMLNGSEQIDAGLTYINCRAGGELASDKVVRDFDGNALTRNDSTGVVIAADPTTNDVTAPTISSIVGTSINAAGDTIAITFSKAMDTNTLNNSNFATRLSQVAYDADGANGGESSFTLTNATGAWSNSNKTFTITLDEGTDGAYIPSGKYIAITPTTNVLDASGNAIAATEVHSAAAVTAEASVPTISSIVGTSVNNGNDTVAITFNEPMTTGDIATGTLNLAMGYADNAAGTTNYVGFTLTNATAAWSNGKKTVTITLDETTDGAFLHNGKYIVVKNTGSPAIHDLVGNLIPTAGAVIGVSASTPTMETTAPTIATTSTLGDATTGGTIENNDTITLNFSEMMYPTTFGAGTVNVVVTNANPSVITIYKGATSVAASDVIATITTTGKQWNTGVASMTFNTSDAAWSSGGKTLTITLKNLTGGTAATGVGAATSSIVAGPALTDAAGNALSTAPVTSASGNF